MGEKAYLGIDPGKGGGLAWIEGGTVEAIPMPETKLEIVNLLRRKLRPSVPTFAVLEKVHSSPQMGVASAFTFGGSFHSLEMLLVVLNIPYDLVPPKTWQKGVMLSYPAKAKDSVKKELGWKRAQALFPQYFAQFGPKTKGVQLAVSDALMMAEFAKRTYGKT